MLPSFLKIDEYKRKELTEADVKHLLFLRDEGHKN